jgi:hypothetical protein
MHRVIVLGLTVLLLVGPLLSLRMLLWLLLFSVDWRVVRLCLLRNLKSLSVLAIPRIVVEAVVGVLVLVLVPLLVLHLRVIVAGITEQTKSRPLETVSGNKELIWKTKNILISPL